MSATHNTMALRCLAALIVCAGLTAASATADAKASMSGSSCLPSSLKATLNQIERRFGPVHILSTFRPGAKIAGTGRTSFHASCRAVDFKPTRNHAQVVAWLKANHPGGVGTYSGSMSHIHIDNGAHVRFHKGGTRYATAGRGKSRRA